ncbi:unnamed protein product [Rhizoctonia solani]|uniref:Uncharacterized protein n=1 Tax=Rhizoctonia solani TaxID=456999 RepID=A0A8H3CXG5_9AGAM|nr:unnamed protein product [Rhizoctonia solani]
MCKYGAQTGQEIPFCDLDFPIKDNSIYLMSLSPDGHYIVTGSNNLDICVWDAHDGHLLLGPLMGHMDDIKSIEFSPDGSHVMSCSSDRTTRFWDVSSCITKIQLTNANGELEEADPSQRADRGPNKWCLDKDGWVVDSEKRRLVWVPSDLRNYLLHPFNDSMISDRGSFKLDFDGVNIGELWIGCYQP